MTVAYILGIMLLSLCLICVFYLLRRWLRMRWQESQKSVAQRAVEAFEKQLADTQQSQQSFASVDLYKLAQAYHYGRHGKRIDLIKAIELYKQSEKGHAWLEIGKIYKDAEQPGWTRDPLKAFEAFLVAAQKYGVEDAWIELGDMYMYGVHPVVLPDKKQAAVVFHKLMTHGSQSGRDIARQRLEHIWSMGYAQDLDALPRPDQQYIVLPRAEQVTDGIFVIQIPTLRHAPPVKRKAQVEVMDLQAQPRVDIDAEVAAGMMLDILPERLLNVVDVQTVFNDSQNVHDSMVQRVVNERLKTMVSPQQLATNANVSHSTVQEQFIQELTNTQDLSQQDKDAAMRVVNSLSNANHSRYNQSEKDVFQKVWLRIHDPMNADRKNELIKVFAQNLASGVENGSVVCSTGKIVRMMGALDGIDKEYEEKGGLLKPEWAIRQEISDKAALIREQFESRGDADNVTGMQSELRRVTEEDYVKAGILNALEHDKILQPYLEAYV